MKYEVENVDRDLIEVAAERANEEQRSLSDVISTLLSSLLREYATGRSWLNVPPQGSGPGSPAVLTDEAVQRAAEVMYRQYDSQYGADHLTWRDFANDARAILTAALSDS